MEPWLPAEESSIAIEQDWQWLGNSKVAPIHCVPGDLCSGRTVTKHSTARLSKSLMFWGKHLIIRRSKFSLNRQLCIRRVFQYKGKFLEYHNPYSIVSKEYENFVGRTCKNKAP